MTARLPTVGCLILAALPLFAASSFAQSTDAKKPPAPAPAPAPEADETGPVVELRPFVVPVEAGPGQQGYVNTQITVFLRVSAGANPNAVCEMFPRVRHAILENLYGSPVSAKYLFDPKDLSNPESAGLQRTPEQAPRDARLVAAVNATLEKTLVSGVIVMRGLKGPGGVENLPLPSVVACETPASEGKGKGKDKKDKDKKDKEKPKAKQ